MAKALELQQRFWTAGKCCDRECTMDKGCNHSFSYISHFPTKNCIPGVALSKFIIDHDKTFVHLTIQNMRGLWKQTLFFKVVCCSWKYMIQKRAAKQLPSSDRSKMLWCFLSLACAGFSFVLWASLFSLRKSRTLVFLTKTNISARFELSSMVEQTLFAMCEGGTTGPK